MRKSEINTTLLEKREYVLLKNRREELSLIPTDYILEYYPKKDDVPTLTLEIPDKVRRGDLVVDYPLYEQFQPRRHIIVKVEGQPVERYVVEDLEIDEEKDVKIKRITAYGYEHILKSKACLIGEGLTRQLYLTPDENVHVGEGILNIFEQQTGWKVNHIDELARKEQVTENVSVTKELMGNMAYPKVDDNTALLEKDFTVPSEQGFPLNFDIAWVDLVVTTTDGFVYKPGSVVHTFTDFHQGIKKIKATFTSNSTQRYGITYDFTLANDEVKTITYAFTNCRGLKLEVKQVNLTYQTSQEEEKLVTKYRYLEYGQSYWYEYLKTTVQEAYGVYIKFNSHDKTIDVYNEEQFGEWKGFYLDYNNLLTKVSKQPDMDELCTRLWIQSNNVDITEVNPMGTSYLEDYSYFEKSGTMSESLKNALKRYYVNIEAQQVKWEEISKLKKSTDQWLTKRNSELTSLNEQVKAKQALLTAYLKAANNEAGQKRVAEELRQLEEQVSTKLREIETLKEQSDNYLSQMQLIGKLMAKETSVDSQGKIFSELDLEELGDITIEQTYTDDYHTKASGLYDYAQTLMKDKASLRYSFSLEHKDLAQNIKHPLGWEWFIELGAKVEIADKDIANKDGFITIYAFKYSPKNKKMESVEFNNNSAVIKAVAGLASFSKVTYNTANLTDFWKETWREAEGATALVSDIRKNGLDLASNIVRGGNTVNKISITESGLFVIDSNNENNQIYVGSSLIAITDDRWVTSKTAIDQGGLIADTVVGRLILGESLFLSNKDGSFSIDAQGLSIKDSSQKEIIGLGVDTNKNTNHFHIGNKNDSAYLIFDENGNLDIKATSVKLSTGDIIDKNEIQGYINDKVSGLQIGARNLVVKSPVLNNEFNQLNTYRGIRTVVDDLSAKSKKHVKFECTTAGTGFYLRIWNGDDSCIDKEYTWSFYAKMNKARRLHAVGHERGGRKDVDVTTDWQKFTHTWTYTTGNAQAFVFYPNFEVGDVLYIRDLKIEEGNKATDWSPAPEDIGFDIATSKQEAINEANKTLTSTISNYYTKAQTESHIEQSKEKIELGVSQKYETIENVKTQVTSTLNSAQSYANDKKNEAIDSANATLSSTISNYYTKKETESAIEVEREKIELGVSQRYETISNVENKVNNAVNSIHIGARNLVLKSKDYSNWVGENGTTINVISTNEVTDILQVTTNGSAGGHVKLKTSGFVRGEKYILSFYAKNVSGNNMIRFEPFGGPVYSINTTSNWEKYEAVIIPQSDINAVDFFFNNKNNTSVFQLKQVKLERGNKVTDWSPAPEDIQASVQEVNNALNNFENTVNGVFKDGVIEEAEAKAIEQHLKTLDSEKSNIDKEYTTVYNNTLLSGTAKTNLASAKASFDSAHSNLKSTINTVIADGRVTPSEKASVDSSFTSYNSVLGTYRQRLQEALEFINNVKANNAKNEAITSANNTLTTTISNYYTKKETDSQIKVEREAIELGVKTTYETKEEVIKKIESIKIGGRNLAQKTSSIYSSPYSGFNGNNNICPSLAKVLTDGLSVGDTVTVRLVYKYTNIVPVSGQTAQCWIQGSGNVTAWNKGAFESSPRKTINGSGEVEFLYNFKITSEHLQNAYWDTNVRHDYVQSGSIQFKMFKVEKGTIPTDWSPAPEDMENSYTIILSNEAQVIPTNSSRVPTSSTTYYTDIQVYKGTSLRTDYSIGNINSANGVTVSKTNSRVDFSVSNNTALTSDSGAFTIPISIDGKTFNKTFSWSASKQGQSGTNGTNGTNGKDAQYVVVNGEQVFKYTNNFTGNPTPSSITLTATKFNTSSAGKWQYKNTSGTWVDWTVNGVVQTGTTLAVSPTSFNLATQKSMSIRYLVGTLYDEITIVKVSDGTNGVNGTNGKDGKDGINGVAGADGVSTYFYVRYSANENGNPMVSVPNSSSKYMGVCSTILTTAPTDYRAYTWTLIKGADGQNGSNGANGVDGKSSYLHIKYSNDGGKTFTGSNGEDLGTWIGTYVDFTLADSMDVKMYSWSKFVGDDGTDARQVIVNGEQVFTYNNNFSGNPINTSITLSAKLIGTTGCQWSYRTSSQTTPTNIQGANGLTLNVAHNASYWGNNKQLVFRCTSGDVYDEISIVKISSGTNGVNGQNGTNGINGQDAYTVFLTNESHIFPATNKGEISTDTVTSTKIVAYKGSQKVTPTISTLPSITGLTITKGSVVNNELPITITAKAGLGLAYSGTFDLVVTVDGKSFTKTFSWSKSLQGANGLNGQNGKDGVDGQDGQDGKGVTSIIEEYYLSTSMTSLANGSWSTTVPTASRGKYIWTRSVIRYTDGASTTSKAICVSGDDGVNGTNGVNGQDGVSITKVDVEYAQSSSHSTAPTSGWATTAPQWVSGKYIWERTKVYYSNGTTTTTQPACITGQKGQDGTNGKGIKAITEYYLVSTTNTGVTSSTSGWSTSVPTLTSTNRYLWNYETVTYTDNSVVSTIPKVIGVYGDKGQDGTNGSDGNGIKSIVNYYLATNSNSGVTISTSGWTTTIQAISPTKKYLWNYEKVSYTNGTVYNSTPCIIGAYGDKGQDGVNGINGQDAITIVLSNETHTFPCESNGNIPTALTTSCVVTAYKGATTVTPTIGNITNPNGMTITKNGSTLNIQANVGTSLADNGVVNIPITVDGKTFTKTFSWTKAKKGVNGANGQNAKTVDIVATSQVFKSTDGGLTFSPDTITLTPKFQSVNYSNWQYSTNGGSTWNNVTSGQNGLTISGSNLTISKSSSLYTQAITAITFRVNTNDSSVYDVMTIIKLYDVADLDIGGRNMLEETDIDKYGLGNWVSNGGALSVDSSRLYTGRKSIKVVGGAGICFNKFVPLARNTVYTYSMMIYSNTAITMNGSTPLHMHLSSSNNGAEHLEIIKGYSGNIPANTWTKVWLIFSTPNVVDTYYMRPFLYGIGNATVNICQPMLEKGNKASDWNEAPEDIHNSIETSKTETKEYTDSQIRVTKEQIELDVRTNYETKTESTSKFNNSISESKKYTDSQISVAKDEINLGVSQTYETKANVESKVSTSKTEAVNSAKSYADTKKQEAINIASSDATSKVNTAKNELNAAIGKKANSADVYTKAETYTKTQTDSAIKIAKEAIELGVSNTYETKSEVISKVNNAVNNIQVGGRNLAQKTSSHYSSPYTSFRGSINDLVQLGKVLTDGLSVGDTVTVRLVYKHTNIVPASGQMAQCWIQGSGDVTGWSAGQFGQSQRKTISGSGEIEFLYNFKITSEHLQNSYWDITIRHDYVQSGSVQFKMFKVEKGTKASDWSLAPEDVDHNISAAKQEAINTSSSDATSKVNNALNDAKSYADVKKNEAISSANNTLNSTIANYYTKTQTDSAIQIAKDAINLGVSQTYETKSNVENKISNAVSDISIGGRNALEKTDIDKCGLGKWKSNNHAILEIDSSKLYAGRKTIKVVGNDGIYYDAYIKLARNTTYTFSMMIHSSVSIPMGHTLPLHMWLDVSPDTGKHLEIVKSKSHETIPANTWTKIWIIFSTPDTADVYYMRPFLYQIGNGTVNVCQPMLEKGNKASEWSPAPEDIDSNISNAKQEAINSAATDATNKVNSAKSELNSTINTKANKADVYTKSETYTRDETDNRIKIEKDAIELGVRNTYETKTEVTNKVNTAIDGIQIGGRNLIKKKSNFKYGYIADYDGTEIITGNSLNGNQDFFTVEYFSLKRGETICFTSYPKQDVTSSVHSAVYIHVYNTSKTWQKAVIGDGLGTNKVASKTYTTTEDCYIRFSSRGFNDYNHMAEYATKASDWSPAPEDTELLVSNTKNEVKQYADSQIQIAKNAITQSVSSTYETKSDATNKINGVNSSISSLTNRVASAESKITEDAITNTVKKNFYTKEQTEGQITSKGYQTASQVQQTVDNVAFKFQESGGYNLLMNSSFKNGLAHWSIGDPNNGVFSVQNAASNTWAFPTATVDTAQIVVDNKTGVWPALVQDFDTIVNQDYTLSLYLACHRVQEGWVAVRDSGTGTWVASHRIQEKVGNSGGASLNNWERVILPFKATSRRYNIIVYVVNAGSNAHLWFAQPQVAVGSKISPYSPNPNEIYQGQTVVDKNGIRVNASNVGSYTQMSADGFYVFKNDGNKLFEATNKVALYNGKGVSCVEIVNDPSANYGNARIDVRGGINFVHNPGQSTGTNQILLGNHDVSNQYGMHNMSIRAWNSLGFQDNNGSTNMFFDTRRGRIIMKGALYQNTATPPRAFSMNFDGEDEVYNSGFTRGMAVDSIMNLKTGVYVDNEGECCSAIYGGHDELVTTEYVDEDGIVTKHLNVEALNASLVVTCQEQQKQIEEQQKQIDSLQQELEQIKRMLSQILN